MALALIVAAGSGGRLGADRPKALVELAGRSLLQRSVDLMLAVGGIDRVVVALPPGVPAPGGTTGVEGGAVRSESVARALAASGPGDPGELIVVHDAARPLASVRLVRAALDTLAAGEELDGAIAAAPVSDTIKRAGRPPGAAHAGEASPQVAGVAGIVVETLERSALWAVQTPQVFRRAVLQRALDVPEEVLAEATDDAWLVERLGGQVAIVPAGAENLKITTALDLDLARLLLARRAAAPKPA